MKNILSLAHWVVLLVVYSGIALKSLTEFSMAFDQTWYHLPIALRMIGRTSFIPEPFVLMVEQAYPYLAEAVQAFLILVSGRLSASNAVNMVGLLFASVCILMLFGKQFPWRWFLTFLLAIPVLVIHFSIGYNDAFAAFMILIGFAGICGLSLNRKKGVSAFLIILGLGCAAATKYPAWLPVAILALFSCYFFWVRFRGESLFHIKKSIIFILLLFAVTSYYPIRNYIRFGNVTYPLSMSDHSLIDIPTYLVHSSPPVRFIHSAFELNRLSSDKPYSWTYDQYNWNEKNYNRMGGWFFATMIIVFGLLLYGFLSKTIPPSLLLMHLVTIGVVSMTNPSFVLRYFLFVPINSLFLLCLFSDRFSAVARVVGRFSLALCALYVIVMLRSHVFHSDFRTPDHNAPREAQEFWKKNLGTVHTKPIRIDGYGALSIFWSGPTFTEIPVIVDQ